MKFELPEQVCDAHIHVGNHFPKILTTFTLDNLEQHMQNYNLDSVLVTAGFDHMRDHTKQLFEYTKHHKQVYMLTRGLTANEFQQALENNGQVVGLKVNPSQEKKRIIDKYFTKHLTILNKHGGILLLHCGRWQEMSSWYFGVQVHKKYPNITLIMAHMGGTHVDFAIPCIEAIRYKQNIYLETSQVRQPIILHYALKKLGSKRILFGSDTPWGSFLPNIAMLFDLDLGLQEQELNNILRDNFKRVIE